MHARLMLLVRHEDKNGQDTAARTGQKEKEREDLFRGEAFIEHGGHEESREEEFALTQELVTGGTEMA